MAKEGDKRKHPNKRGVTQTFKNGKWRTIRGTGGTNKKVDKKTKNQFARYSERYTKLSKIKKPNDFQKNQLEHARRMRDEAGGKIQSELNYSKEDQESIKRRQNVRQNPVSEETLAEVRKQTEKLKIDKEKTTPTTTTTPSEKEDQNKQNAGISAKSESTKVAPLPTNVFTRHYKTGKTLGVMTRAERRAYEKEAGQKTYESEVGKHHEKTKSPSRLKETKYKASLRKKVKSLRKKDKKKTNASVFAPQTKNIE